MDDNSMNPAKNKCLGVLSFWKSVGGSKTKGLNNAANDEKDAAKQLKKEQKLQKKLDKKMEKVEKKQRKELIKKSGQHTKSIDDVNDKITFGSSVFYFGRPSTLSKSKIVEASKSMEITRDYGERDVPSIRHIGSQNLNNVNMRPRGGACNHYEYIEDIESPGLRSRVQSYVDMVRAGVVSSNWERKNMEKFYMELEKDKEEMRNSYPTISKIFRQKNCPKKIIDMDIENYEKFVEEFFQHPPEVPLKVVISSGVKSCEPHPHVTKRSKERILHFQRQRQLEQKIITVSISERMRRRRERRVEFLKKKSIYLCSEQARIVKKLQIKKTSL